MGDVWSGLATANMLDASPPALRVTSIAWDSPFRATPLAVGDRIVAVDGRPLTAAAALAPGELAAMIGQSGEFNDAAPGIAVKLRVLRRAPVSGWNELEIAAALSRQPWYRSPENREILGQGGPITMEDDGFYTGGWGGWSEQSLDRLARLLDVEPHGTFVSQFEARDLREKMDERVAYAVAHYPGPWSRAVAADYAAALGLCDGEVVELPSHALDFRRRGEELAAQVRAHGSADWEAFKAAHAADTIPAAPAPNPTSDDIASLVGKCVVLPPLGNDGYLSDGARTWFAAGDGENGYWYVDAEGEACQAMLRAQRRYTKLVDPNQTARWEFVGQVTAAPKLCAIGSRAYFGLIVEPLAALVGEAMFVDLTARQGDQVPFSGEAGLVDETPDLPPDAASPADVVAAVVAAVKNGDLELWKALHAHWWTEVLQLPDGGTATLINQIGREPEEARFEDARRSLGERVLDARPAWTGEPEPVVPAGRYPGADGIDEVVVWVDHVGEFDGVRRTFSDVTTNGRWTLQRVGHGPWRVAEAGLI